MSNLEKVRPLVRGITISGTDSQWTLLGTSENNAAETVASARSAAVRLSAWTVTALAASVGTTVIKAQKIEPEIATSGKRARQVNGVSKALSPEYRVMFGALSADFICVESSLLRAPVKPK